MASLGANEGSNSHRAAHRDHAIITEFPADLLRKLAIIELNYFNSVRLIIDYGANPTFLAFDSKLQPRQNASTIRFSCSCKLFACKLVWPKSRRLQCRLTPPPLSEGPMLSPVKPVHIQAAADLNEERLDGWRREQTTPSLAEVFGSIRTRPTGPMWRKLLAFLGPGYLVAVGYMDPGNWATSLAGGSKFGYVLLSIALLSNIMAIILQALCARLGVASCRDLAQACRDAFPRFVSYPLWAAAELAICATDLAEVIGTAIGLNLLFGIPLEIGVILTALDVFLILWMQRLG